MIKTFTGKEICSRYNDIENDSFGTDQHHFILTKIAKEDLYAADCSFSSNGKNLLSFKEWEKDPGNYDNYHTDNIHQMVEYLREGNALPPLIVDKKLGLYDGQHRLTACSMIPEIGKIDIYKEI